MRDWFNAQTQRDQMALIALVGAVALYSLLTFALLPASEARSKWRQITPLQLPSSDVLKPR